jgi:glycosyltransferase involved in cell wall biosynthesis
LIEVSGPDGPSIGLSVTVVVPTRDSERTLRPCLRSLRAQSVPCTIVVVDNHSRDDTIAIARDFADQLIHEGPERSRQRNTGAAAAVSDVVGFVDSDMYVSLDVVNQVRQAIEGGAGAVIVPERTVGRGYWAKVRAFERSFYVGHDGVEAARFFRRDVFESLGGFDEELGAGEDWDLDLRARALTKVVRIAAWIDHNEDDISYRDRCRRKGAYALGLQGFTGKHGLQALATALDRPYIRRPWRLLAPHPLLGVGVVVLKAGESFAVCQALLAERSRLRQRWLEACHRRRLARWNR